MYQFIANIFVLSALATAQFFVQDSTSSVQFFSEQKTQTIKQPKRVNNYSLGIELSAKSTIIVDKESNAILYSKNVNSALPMASITKLMTALVILDQNPEWEKVVTVVKDDQRNGNIVYVTSGDEVTIKDLFNLMLVASSNEAAVALVRSFGPDEQTFIEKMNAMAKDMNLRDTVFFDPTGLDSRNISSARDIAALSRSAFNRLEIRNITHLSKYEYKILSTKKVKTAYNTNKLLNSFLNDKNIGYEVLAAKTGYVDEAGYNITIEISKDNHPIIITTLGSPDEKSRWQDIKGLADWIYRNYTWDKAT